MTTSETTAQAANLHDYGVLLRRQWWVFLLAVLLGVLAAGTYTYTSPKTYTSVTDVLVTATGVDNSSVSANGRTRTEINLDTEAQLLKSTAVVALARDQLGLSISLDALGDRVSVSVPPNTEVLTISYRGDSPQAAQEGAAAFATAYLASRAQGADDEVSAQQEARQSQILTLTTNLQAATSALTGVPLGSPERALIEAQIQSLSAQIATLTSETNELDSLSITPGRVITDANRPQSASSPVVPLNLAGGAMLGLLAGCGVALLLQRRDRRLHDAAQVSRDTGLPILVEIPTEQSMDIAAPGTPEGRAYVRLRNALTASTGAEAADRTGGTGVVDRASQVVLVAAVQPDGSAVATNLAVALARTDAKVVLVATHPASRVARRLGIARRGAGLSEALERSGRALNGALRVVPAIPGLSVLLPGRDPDRAAALLQTDHGRELISALRDSADFVVLDVSPTSQDSQAQSLAPLADAVLLVVIALACTRDDTGDAVAQFQAVRTPLLGGVLLPAVEKGGSRRSQAASNRAEAAAIALDELADAREVPVTEPTEPAGTDRRAGGATTARVGRRAARTR